MMQSKRVSMSKAVTIRKTHRWLAIVVAVQLLAWTGSGFYFALIPIEQIRGEHLIDEEPALMLRHVSLISPNLILRNEPALTETRVDEVQLKQRLNRAVYMIKQESQYIVFDAETGQRLPQLTDSEAIDLVASRTKLPVHGAEMVTEKITGGEYRGGELPAWRVALADDSQVYVGAASGQIRAVRTDEWRLFDLLWSLHIMDYDARDNFNHPLLQIAAALAIISILSGLGLFITSTHWWRQRRVIKQPS